MEVGDGRPVSSRQSGQAEQVQGQSSAAGTSRGSDLATKESNEPSQQSSACLPGVQKVFKVRGEKKQKLDPTSLELQGTRRSSRTIKKSKRVLDSTETASSSSSGAPGPVKKKPRGKGRPRKRDRLSDGQPFSCSLCESHYINNMKSSKSPFAGPRTSPVIKEKDGRLMKLCVKCAYAIQQTEKKRPSADERYNFKEEGKQFAQHLANYLQDEDAKRLYCCLYQVSPCGCIQNFISGNMTKKKQHISLPGQDTVKTEEQPPVVKSLNFAPGTDSAKTEEQCEPVKGDSSSAPDEKADKAQRAKFLLSLLKEARDRRQKFRKKRKVSDHPDMTPRQTFKDFVMKKRLKLKELGLCERGCQKVLFYSNNFLHRKPTTPGSTLSPFTERTKGRAIMGLLEPVANLSKLNCCSNNCVKMANTKREQVTEWREMSTRSQKERLRAIAEILKPSESNLSPCFKFASMVTGACNYTVQKVYAQLMLSKGKVGEQPLMIRQIMSDQGSTKGGKKTASKAGSTEADSSRTQTIAQSQVVSQSPLIPKLPSGSLTLTSGNMASPLILIPVSMPANLTVTSQPQQQLFTRSVSSVGPRMVVPGSFVENDAKIILQTQDQSPAVLASTSRQASQVANPKDLSLQDEHEQKLNELKEKQSSLMREMQSLTQNLAQAGTLEKLLLKGNELSEVQKKIEAFNIKKNDIGPSAKPVTETPGGVGNQSEAPALQFFGQAVNSEGLQPVVPGTMQQISFQTMLSSSGPLQAESQMIQLHSVDSVTSASQTFMAPVQGHQQFSQAGLHLHNPQQGLIQIVRAPLVQTQPMNQLAVTSTPSQGPVSLVSMAQTSSEDSSRISVSKINSQSTASFSFLTTPSSTFYQPTHLKQDGQPEHLGQNLVSTQVYTPTVTSSASTVSSASYQPSLHRHPEQLSHAVQNSALGQIGSDSTSKITLPTSQVLITSSSSAALSYASPSQAIVTLTSNSFPNATNLPNSGTVMTNSRQNTSSFLSSIPVPQVSTPSGGIQSSTHVSQSHTGHSSETILSRSSGVAQILSQPNASYTQPNYQQSPAFAHQSSEAPIPAYSNGSTTPQVHTSSHFPSSSMTSTVNNGHIHNDRVLIPNSCEVSTNVSVHPKSVSSSMLVSHLSEPPMSNSYIASLSNSSPLNNISTSVSISNDVLLSSHDVSITSGNVAAMSSTSSTSMSSQIPLSSNVMVPMSNAVFDALADSPVISSSFIVPPSAMPGPPQPIPIMTNSSSSSSSSSLLCEMLLSGNSTMNQSLPSTKPLDQISQLSPVIVQQSPQTSTILSTVSSSSTSTSTFSSQSSVTCGNNKTGSTSSDLAPVPSVNARSDQSTSRPEDTCNDSVFASPKTTCSETQSSSMSQFSYSSAGHAPIAFTIGQQGSLAHSQLSVGSSNTSRSRDPPQIGIVHPQCAEDKPRTSRSTSGSSSSAGSLSFLSSPVAGSLLSNVFGSQDTFNLSGLLQTPGFISLDQSLSLNLNSSGTSVSDASLDQLQLANQTVSSLPALLSVSSSSQSELSQYQSLQSGATNEQAQSSQHTATPKQTCSQNTSTSAGAGSSASSTSQTATQSAAPQTSAANPSNTCLIAIRCNETGQIKLVPVVFSGDPGAPMLSTANDTQALLNAALSMQTNQLAQSVNQSGSQGMNQPIQAVLQNPSAQRQNIQPLNQTIVITNEGIQNSLQTVLTTNQIQGADAVLATGNQNILAQTQTVQSTNQQPLASSQSFQPTFQAGQGSIQFIPSTTGNNVGATHQSAQVSGLINQQIINLDGQSRLSVQNGQPSSQSVVSATQSFAPLSVSTCQLTTAQGPIQSTMGSKIKPNFPALSPVRQKLDFSNVPISMGEASASQSSQLNSGVSLGQKGPLQSFLHQKTANFVSQSGGSQPKASSSPRLVNSVASYDKKVSTPKQSSSATQSGSLQNQSESLRPQMISAVNSYPSSNQATVAPINSSGQILNSDGVPLQLLSANNLQTGQQPTQFLQIGPANNVLPMCSVNNVPIQPVVPANISGLQQVFLQLQSGQTAGTGAPSGGVLLQQPGQIALQINQGSLPNQFALQTSQPSVQSTSASNQSSISNQVNINSNQITFQPSQLTLQTDPTAAPQAHIAVLPNQTSLQANQTNVQPNQVTIQPAQISAQPSESTLQSNQIAVQSNQLPVQHQILLPLNGCPIVLDQGQVTQTILPQPISSSTPSTSGTGPSPTQTKHRAIRPKTQPSTPAVKSSFILIPDKPGYPAYQLTQVDPTMIPNFVPTQPLQVVAGQSQQKKTEAATLFLETMHRPSSAHGRMSDSATPTFSKSPGSTDQARFAVGQTKLNQQTIVTESGQHQFSNHLNTKVTMPTAVSNESDALKIDQATVSSAMLIVHPGGSGQEQNSLFSIASSQFMSNQTIHIDPSQQMNLHATKSTEQMDLSDLSAQSSGLSMPQSTATPAAQKRAQSTVSPQSALELSSQLGGQHGFFPQSQPERIRDGKSSSEVILNSSSALPPPGSGQNLILKLTPSGQLTQVTQSAESEFILPTTEVGSSGSSSASGLTLSPTELNQLSASQLSSILHSLVPSPSSGQHGSQLVLDLLCQSGSSSSQSPVVPFSGSSQQSLQKSNKDNCQYLHGKEVIDLTEEDTPPATPMKPEGTVPVTIKSDGKFLLEELQKQVPTQSSAPLQIIHQGVPSSQTAALFHKPSPIKSQPNQELLKILQSQNKGFTLGFQAPEQMSSNNLNGTSSSIPVAEGPSATNSVAVTAVTFASSTRLYVPSTMSTDNSVGNLRGSETQAPRQLQQGVNQENLQKVLTSITEATLSQSVSAAQKAQLLPIGSAGLTIPAVSTLPGPSRLVQSVPTPPVSVQNPQSFAFVRATNTPTDAVGPPNITVVSSAYFSPQGHLQRSATSGIIPVLPSEAIVSIPPTQVTVIASNALQGQQAIESNPALTVRNFQSARPLTQTCVQPTQSHQNRVTILAKSQSATPARADASGSRKTLNSTPATAGAPSKKKPKLPTVSDILKQKNREAQLKGQLANQAQTNPPLKFVQKGPSSYAKDTPVSQPSTSSTQSSSGVLELPGADSGNLLTLKNIHLLTAVRTANGDVFLSQAGTDSGITLTSTNAPFTILQPGNQLIPQAQFTSSESKLNLATARNPSSSLETPRAQSVPSRQDPMHSSPRLIKSSSSVPPQSPAGIAGHSETLSALLAKPVPQGISTSQTPPTDPTQESHGFIKVTLPLETVHSKKAPPNKTFNKDPADISTAKEREEYVQKKIEEQRQLIGQPDSTASGKSQSVKVSGKRQTKSIERSQAYHNVSSSSSPISSVGTPVVGEPSSSQPGTNVALSPADTESSKNMEHKALTDLLKSPNAITQSVRDSFPATVDTHAVTQSSHLLQLMSAHGQGKLDHQSPQVLYLTRSLEQGKQLPEGQNQTIASGTGLTQFRVVSAGASTSQAHPDSYEIRLSTQSEALVPEAAEKTYISIGSDEHGDDSSGNALSGQNPMLSKILFEQKALMHQTSLNATDKTMPTNLDSHGVKHRRTLSLDSSSKKEKMKHLLQHTPELLTFKSNASSTAQTVKTYNQIPKIVSVEEYERAYPPPSYDTLHTIKGKSPLESSGQPKRPPLNIASSKQPVSGYRRIPKVIEDAYNFPDESHEPTTLHLQSPKPHRHSSGSSVHEHDKIEDIQLSLTGSASADRHSDPMGRSKVHQRAGILSPTELMGFGSTVRAGKSRPRRRHSSKLSSKRVQFSDEVTTQPDIVYAHSGSISTTVADSGHERDRHGAQAQRDERSRHLSESDVDDKHWNAPVTYNSYDPGLAAEKRMINPQASHVSSDIGGLYQQKLVAASTIGISSEDSFRPVLRQEALGVPRQELRLLVGHPGEILSPSNEPSSPIKKKSKGFGKTELFDTASLSVSEKIGASQGQEQQQQVLDDSSQHRIRHKGDLDQMRDADVLSSFKILSPQGYSKLSQNRYCQRQQLDRDQLQHQPYPTHKFRLVEQESEDRSQNWSHSSDSSEQTGVEISQEDPDRQPSESPLVRQKALRSDFEIAQQMQECQQQEQQERLQHQLNLRHEGYQSGIWSVQGHHQEEQLSRSQCLGPQTSDTFRGSEHRHSELPAGPQAIRFLAVTTDGKDQLMRHRRISGPDRQWSFSHLESDSQEHSASPAAGTSHQMLASELENSLRKKQSQSSPLGANMIKYSPSLEIDGARILDELASRSHYPWAPAGFKPAEPSRSRNPSGSKEHSPLAGSSSHSHDLRNRISGHDLDAQAMSDFPRVRHFSSKSIGANNELMESSINDLFQRNRNPSASSLKSNYLEAELFSLIDYRTRSRNPSSSSWIHDLPVIRSRNPSGSSNRRSRPGSSSSDKELFMNFDDLPAFTDFRSPSRNSGGESIEPTINAPIEEHAILQYLPYGLPRAAKPAFSTPNTNGRGIDPPPGHEFSDM